MHVLVSTNPVKLFATSGSDILAEDICRHLKDRLPPELQHNGDFVLNRPLVHTFSNDNIEVQVDDVRGKYVVIIHTQTPPVNDNLIELFALIDAINNARPADLLLVFPYMPFSRSDRKNKPRISTMGVRLPHIVTCSLGVKRVILLDPHDSHIKHYFTPAADEITTLYLFADYLETQFFPTNPREDCVLVFADAGSAKRCEDFKHLVKLRTAYIDKERPNDDEEPDVQQLVGVVKGKTCILIDDEILTGGTAIKDTEILIREGACKVIMLAVHPVFNDLKTGAQAVCARLQASPIDQFIVTDSIPVSDKLTSFPKCTVVSVAPLLAEAINRTVLDQSLTALRDMQSVDLYRP